MGSSFRATVFRDEQYPGATVPGVLQYPSYSTRGWVRPNPATVPELQYPRLLQYLGPALFIFGPLAQWADLLHLLSTFVLTPFLIFTEEDPDFVPEDVE